MNLLEMPNRKKKMVVLEETIVINKSPNKFPFINKIKERLREIKALVPPNLYYMLISSVFLVIFVTVIFFMVLLYFLQDALLYLPDHPGNSRSIVSNPSLHGLPYEDLYFTTDDGVLLHAFLIKQTSDAINAFTILYFHGNAGNIGHRLPNVAELYHKCLVNIFLLEYRGYGWSQGTPSEEGLLIDSTAAIELISSRHDLDRGKIVLFGRSLGGAVAVGTAFANPNKVAGLIVENTFTSTIDMARSIFKIPIFGLVPNFLIRNKFLSIEKIGKVEIPSLFISGLEDELVPPWMMRSLYETSKSIIRRLFLCRSGKHNDSWRCSGYYEMIAEFLSEVNRFQKGEKVKPSLEVTSPT